MKENRLKDYALWYYFKHFPSKKRLFEKVFWKSGKNQEITEKIFSEIEHLIEEEKNVESRVKFCLDRNKNKRYILTNLLQKGYEKEMIQDIIEKFTQEKWGSLLNAYSLRAKIIAYKQKWKSKSYITSKFVESPQDKEIVEGIVNEVFWETEDENLQKEYGKIKWKYERQKIIEKLLRKWFVYDDIKKIVD